MADTGTYMYAFCRGLTAGSLSTSKGIDGNELRLVGDDGLSIAVSTVSLDEFGEQKLHDNLTNPQWLEKVARAHDSVVNRLSQCAPTAPLRLATICLDDAAARQRLIEQHGPLTKILDAIEGRAEWSVKAYSLPDNGPETPDRDQTESGTNYLTRKREQATRHASRSEQAAQLSEQSYDEIKLLATDSRRLALQDPRLTGRTGMTLNAAFLVPHAQSAEFQNAVAQAANKYPQLEVTVDGPWPAYSFVAMEEL